ncbi:MAG: Flp pilus assembly complex ATPase component TadA [Deltaproteobacteria bacterium]|jgi:type II secretory ATPase GspE/PulE/Tfp pilus assembly ATPase PilB-like protein/CheY-like chemotaxis protein|nr:Flp pilus assembly complex ATPase component TadA [Deltaproteobacteria bacterium]
MEKMTILTVDDDQDILALVDQLLTRKNYKVIRAENGVKALDILDRQKPDIILLDIMMKDMSGYEVCWRIQEREDLTFIPVIFLTSLSAEKNKSKAFSLGAVDFLVKPINKQLLYSVIEKHAATENRWRRFILSKDKGKDAAGREKKAGYLNRTFPAFRDFLFEFLNIPADKRDKMKPFNTEELTETLHDSQILAQSRFIILMAQFTGLEYLPVIETGSIMMDVLPPSFSKHNKVIALGFQKGIAFALTDPFNSELIDILTGMKPEKLFIASPEAIAGVYRIESETDTKIDDLVKNVRELYSNRDSVSDSSLPGTDESRLGGREIDLDASPLVLFINSILEKAYIMRASDIHIEPREKDVVVRCRVDGELNIIHRLEPRELINVISSRIKIMSNLDIAERRLPQDGRFAFKEFTGRPFDFDVRVSCAPMNYGEKIVMRILDKQKTLLPLEDLGFSQNALVVYRRQLRSPYGMILHVGPTGSGKSMSLYSALNEINQPNINIQTAEDPIEYTLEGINQMQVNSSIGLTFKSALRCFLRQDPDTILVGEIRDLETAEIAVEAALTGHLLLSTLHTNDAPSTITRFIEMGIEPYMVSSSIVLICAQRLLRRLCPKCRESYLPDDAERLLAEVMPNTPATFYRAVGCSACNDSGYQGRVGIYELLVPDESLRAAMNSENISTEMIRDLALNQGGMISLFQDAMEKVRAGITSMQEAVSKTKSGR